MDTQPEYADLVIFGGTIIDGSGESARLGTVVVRGDRIRVIDASDEAPQSPRRIDATGRVVSPGFIDVHSHGGLPILAEPRHEAHVLQGVTTEVIGVDGSSFAPFDNSDVLFEFVRYDSGLNDRPDISYDWDTVASFLTHFDNRVSLNIATFIGNSALRIAALGWDNTRADASAIARQRALLREGMEEGAFGISSGLDYPPGAYATTQELSELVNEAGRAGGFYHTHIRYPLGDGYLDPLREAVEIGRRSDAPVHVTHLFHLESYPDGPGPLLDFIEGARAEGLDVTFDTFPSEWSSTKLLIQLPGWMLEGGPSPLLERLGRGSDRDRLREWYRAAGIPYAGPSGWDDVRLGGLRSPANSKWEARTVADVMDGTGRDAVDVICDLLVSEDLAVSQVWTGPWLPGLRPFIQHPVGMIGSDSVFVGAKPSPRTYGSFARVLGQFVRDEALMSLEEAIRKMTSAPAQRLGLIDRGVLRNGAYADVVVFDPEAVGSRATYESPRVYPDGIDHVVVNGTLVVEAGVHNGATPGRALRHGRP